MKKKVLAVILAVIMLMVSVVPALAAQKWTVPRYMKVVDGVGTISTLFTSELTIEQQSFIGDWMNAEYRLLYCNGFGISSYYRFIIFEEPVTLSSFSFSGGLFYISTPSRRLTFSGRSPSNPSSADGGLTFNTVPVQCYLQSLSEASSGDWYLSGIIDCNFDLPSKLADFNMNLNKLIIEDDAGLFPPPIASHNLTINYQYTDGSQAAESVVQSLNANAAYSVASPEIAGFTPDKPIVSGTMPDKNLTVTVTYHENILLHVLTVSYQYEDGIQAAPEHISSRPGNAPYYVTSPVIDGFEADKTAVSGTMPDDDLSVNVTYHKKTGGGDGGDSGGGDGGNPENPDNPFLPPPVVPWDGYNPFVKPDLGEWDGYNPFEKPDSGKWDGYNPFVKPELGAWGSYNPFINPFTEAEKKRWVPSIFFFYGKGG